MEEEKIEIQEKQNIQLSEETQPAQQQPKKKINKFKLFNASQENDIKYRPPLSYRGLRIVGWIFIILSQVAVIIKAISSISDTESLSSLSTVHTILSFLSLIPIPLFLIANFSYILNHRNSYKHLFIFYGLISVGLYALFALIYFRYGIGIVSIIDKDNAQPMLDAIVKTIFSDSLSFNIFIDLFLCTAITFFICYTPKNHFRNKKIAWFRLLVAIPIAYEIVAIILKVLDGRAINLPAYLFPLMPSKSPLILLLFIACVIYLKIYQTKYKKAGKTQMEYLDYQQTNVSALKFSIFVSVGLVVASILDLVLVITLARESTIAKLLSLGIGKNMFLFLAIPFIMLFGYNKKVKPGAVDIIIPLASLGAIALIWVEAAYQIISILK